MQEYQNAERKILLQVARTTIERYIISNELQAIELADYPEQLGLNRACFVTLHLRGHLRGCIGSLQAHRPLVIDVAQNAFNAAFKDPRFKPLDATEYPEIKLEISVLSPPKPIEFRTETDLINKLRPGVDGLILYDKGHRATFLPSVWDEVPDPLTFLQHLKAKAGLPTNYWSDSIKADNYTTELIS